MKITLSGEPGSEILETLLLIKKAKMSVSCHIAHSHQIESTNTKLDTIDASLQTIDTSISGISSDATAAHQVTNHTKLDTINTTLGGTLTVDASGSTVPVSGTESPTEAFGSNDYSAGWANNTSTTAVDMNGYRTFSFAQALPNTSFGSETLVLEGSTDNVTFYHISDEYPSIATDSSGSSAYAWNVSYSDLPFRYVRVTNRTGASIACSGPAMYHRTN